MSSSEPSMTKITSKSVDFQICGKVRLYIAECLKYTDYDSNDVKISFVNGQYSILF